MKEIINADLANNIGNFIQRILSMIFKNLEGIIPAKKEGVDTPKIAKALAERSIQVSWFTADITPKKIPISVAKIIAVIARIKVLGIVSAKIALTSLLV